MILWLMKNGILLFFFFVIMFMKNIYCIVIFKNTYLKLKYIFTI